MNKQTKMLLGLAVVAGAGYYIWQKNKPATKANVAGKGCRVDVSWKKTGVYKMGSPITVDGVTFCKVGNGIYSMR